VAYVGNQPARGQWRKLSDISSGFNGITTTFTTSVPPGTSEYFVTAGSASQLLVSLGGVIQQPDVDYTVSTNSVTFTTPPTSGLSFFGVLCGDALNAGVPSDGSVTTSKLAGGLSVGLTGGSASNPSLFFTGDDNTGLFSPSADTIAFAEGGAEALRIDSSGRLLVGTSSARSNWANTTGVAPLFQIESSGAVRASIARTDATAGGPQFWFGKTRGSAYEVVSNNDLIGQIAFMGADGSELVTGAAIEAFVDGTPGADDMPGRLVFSTTNSPTERMRISNNGNVTIMNTSITPTGGMLELSGNNGDITDPLSASLTNTLRLTDRDSSSAASQVTGSIQWYTGDATQPGVHSYIAAKSDTFGAGTISIGVRTSGGTVADAITIAPNREIRMLAVYDDTVGATNRDLYIDDTGKLGYVSSIRASKTNIVELSDVNWLYALEPVSFNRRKQNELEEYIDEAYCETEYGLIAEDVEQVAPELCFYSKVDGVDELRGVHYSKLIAPLLKAVQELKAENESLKARVAVLEAN
jgi:hypothetical protein